MSFRRLWVRAMGEHNRRRALADTVSLDAWKGEVGAKGKFDLHVDVTFGVGRLGGEVDDKARFKLSLKRAEVVVIISPNEPAKVDKGSVARTETAGVVIKDVVTQQSEGAIAAAVGIDASVSERGAKAKAKAGAKAKASKSKKAVTTITRQTSSMIIVQSQTVDGDYRWSISGAVAEMMLDGKPWDADRVPRMKVIDTRRDRSRGIEPSVRVEVRCLRDDLKIENIVLKDDKAWANLLKSPSHRNRYIAAEAVIRDRLFKAGLVHGALGEPYAQMCLAEAIVGEDA